MYEYRFSDGDLLIYSHYYRWLFGYRCFGVWCGIYTMYECTYYFV